MSQIEPITTGRKTAAFKQLMFLHWLMAACFLLVYITGMIVPRVNKELFFAELFPFLHQSLGVMVTALLVARIFLLLQVLWRKHLRRFPKATPAWIRLSILHTILYFFMLTAPISGFLLLNCESKAVTFFNVTVPPIFPESKETIGLARNAHFWLSYIFLAFIFLHTLAQWKVVRAIWRRVGRLKIEHWNRHNF